MKNVMTKAWEIARKGAGKFGGKAKEYFAIALKMAWSSMREVSSIPELSTVVRAINNDLTEMQLTLWSNYGKVRIYVKQNVKKYGLTDMGFIELNNLTIVSTRKSNKYSARIERDSLENVVELLVDKGVHVV